MTDGVVGTWELEGFTVHRKGRPPVHPYGEDAFGRIVYTANGYVTAVISARDRGAATVDLESARLASSDDKAAWFDSYLSYTGRWTVTDGRVQHAIDAALVPSMVDRMVEREARLSDGRLVLAYQTISPRGTVRSFVLRWRRADG